MTNLRSAFVTFLAVMCVCIPVAISAFISDRLPGRILQLVVGVILFFITFPIVCGILSIPFQKRVMPGRFKRELTDPIYFYRVCYGKLWTSIYYSSFLYNFILGFPLFRRVVFHLFGYRGSHKITIFPDCWFRDLPLCEFSAGVYVANKSTLGTNLCLSNQICLVDRIILKEDVMIGHSALVGLGTVLERATDAGVNANIGLRVSIGEDVTLSPRVSINHGSKLGAHCVVGTQSYVGVRARVAPSIKIPPLTIVPDGVTVSNQVEADGLFSSEYQLINMEKEKLAKILSSLESIEAL